MTTVTTPMSNLKRMTIPTLVSACLAGLLLPAVAGAQVCGDVTADDTITTSDALRVLKAAVGQPVELVCTDQCAALAVRVAALEALLANVTIQGDNLVLTGMNLQVVSGSGETDEKVNGTGNIIIGYDESNSGDEKDGSHNLVIGRYHSYPNYGGIVAGEDNEISGKVASVLGGALNSAESAGAVVVGGIDNRAFAETSVVLAGEKNFAGGRSCSIASGFKNACTGVAGGVSGGSQNICNGDAAILSGGSNRILDTNGAWMAGGLFQAQ